MKVEGRDTVEEVKFVQISIDAKRCDLPRTLHDRWAKPKLIDDRHSKTLHHRTRILTEALLARDERIPMMHIFHLPLVQIVGTSNVMMGTDHEARSFSLQPLADCGYFFRGRLLLRNQVVESEYH